MSGNSNQETYVPKGRKPKQGNSELFNELLSAANALPVSERTRLVKSLAGQLNLVVVGASELLSKAGNQPSQKEKDEAKPVVKQQVKPNPLKGTIFDQEKIKAYNALIEAKKEAGGAKLPPDHPAVLGYATALAAYKVEHNRLKPVDDQQPNQPARREGKKGKARTTTDRSPEPGSAQPRKSLIGAIKDSVRKATSSSSQKGKDGDMDLL
jgi:hypothetical protein